MPHRPIAQFRKDRCHEQERLLDTEHVGLKRFMNLDTAAYRDLTEKGGLDAKTKELLGLIASTALRCNDCIDYHLEQCVELGWTMQEIEDGLNVAMIVGGSITIPHLRHAKLTLEELFAEQS
jgi:AhpD family alkylhydroperoxidase